MALLLLALLQAVAQPATPPLARDWDTLPRIPLNSGTRMAAEDLNAVRELARREECRASVGPMVSATSGEANMRGLRVDLAVLVAPDGSFLAIRAAPGPCDPIRNYARAIINGRYRGHVRGPEGPGPAWYGTTLNFAWAP